jgi:hypothetical protein
MSHHTSIGGILFLAGGKRIYSTRDGGKTVQLIEEIEHGFITSLAYDARSNCLYVGTTGGGVYALKITVG